MSNRPYSRWYRYELRSPIDFGIGYLTPCWDVLRHKVLRMENGTPDAKNFMTDWINARLYAKCRQLGPLLGEWIFPLPDEEGIGYGFLFKTDNKGTTVIASPIPLPWLEPLSCYQENTHD